MSEDTRMTSGAVEFEATAERPEATRLRTALAISRRTCARLADELTAERVAHERTRAVLARLVAERTASDA